MLSLPGTHRALRVLAALVALSVAPSPAWALPPVHSQGPNLGTYSIGEVQIPLGATSGDGSNYAWSVFSGLLPPGVDLRTDLDSWFPGGSSAGLIGVATTPGTYNFTLRVTSDGADTDLVYTVRIAPLVVTNSSNLPNAFVNTAYSFTLSGANNAGALTWAVLSGVPSGMTLGSTGVLSGTPDTPGFYNINYTISDGVDTLYRNVSIGIFAVRITTPPVLPNATNNVPYSATVLASGGAGGYTFSANGLPNGLSMAPNGAITGTPNNGAGNWSLNVTVTDSAASSSNLQMSLNVVGVPKALPQVHAYSNMLDHCTLGVNCERPVGVTAGGTAPFTWAASGLPPGTAIRTGSLMNSYITPGDVEIWGSPTATGVYNVTLTVTDAEGKTGTQTFSLRVSTLL